MPADVRINGAAVRDITTFYKEVNRVFMAGETWRLGESLDALNDLLYGGYGALAGRTGARVVWADHESSRRALGRETTIAYYESKLEQPGVFDVARARSAIADLEAGTGSTYFDIVLEVFADHPDVELVLA